MKLELLQFIIAKGAGDSAIRRLISFAQAKGIDAVGYLCNDAKELSKEIGIKLHVSEQIVSSRDSAEELLETLLSNKVEMIWLNHNKYPGRLPIILEKNAPTLLFAKGNIDLLKKKSVGFCGSRKTSDKGLLITSQCSSQIIEHDYTVISGYAHGVDMSAHRTALEMGGTTIIVLVDGILQATEKRDLKDFLNDENHLFLSQFPPMLTWLSHNAMKRNGTIIGLSDAMILVESGLDGGTFAAGEETLNRKMPLFVIDFAEPRPSAKANSYFLEKGGLPIRGNKLGTPNLSKLFEIVDTQIWKTDHQKELSIFDIDTPLTPIST